MNSIVLIAPSGNGKSTWTKQFIQTHPSYISINRDSLRASFFTTLDNYYTHSNLKAREEFITTMSDVAIYQAKLLKKDIVIDATNLQKKYLEPLISNLIKFSTVQYKIFEVDKIVAKQRVLCRDFGYLPELFDKNAINWVDIDVDTCKEVAYIDKQYEQFQEIKEWITSQNLIKQL